MNVPATIEVRLQWRTGTDLPDNERSIVERELAALSWELNQAQALLHDVARIGTGERAYLMPRIELRLPLYEAHRRLRIIFSAIDAPRIHLVDEEGKRMAEIALL